MTKRRASLADRELPMATIARSTDDLLLGAERARQNIEELKLRDILPNRLQPRTQPKPEGLQELAESIRMHGVLEPVIVRSIGLTEYEGVGRRYELVAGERRWRASLIAGRETIPAIITQSAGDDRAMLELAITENLQREDLHPLDEALAFGRMQNELDYSYSQIAERIGKSKGYVQNRMRLLQINEDLQQLIAERPDTLKHVYEIDRITDPLDRAAIIAAVRDDALSFNETRARVQALLAPPAESYSREYDSEKDHESQGGGTQHSDSYSREYDSGRIHNLETSAADLPSPVVGKQPPESEIGYGLLDSSSDRLLTARERAAVLSVTAKVDRVLVGSGGLVAEEVEMLSALAHRLNELLRQLRDAQG